MSEVKPVSEKQLKWLRQFKVPEDIIATLNSKSASDILSAKFGEDEDKIDPVPQKPGVQVDPKGTVYEKPIAKPYEKDPVGLVIDLMVSGMPREQAIADVKLTREAFE